MRIVDAWKQNNSVLAYCVGEDISINFSWKKILCNMKEFDVKAVDVQTSFTGIISATLMLDLQSYYDIKPGEIEIIR